MVTFAFGTLSIETKLFTDLSSLHSHITDVEKHVLVEESTRYPEVYISVDVVDKLESSRDFRIGLVVDSHSLPPQVAFSSASNRLFLGVNTSVYVFDVARKELQSTRVTDAPFYQFMEIVGHKIALFEITVMCFSNDGELVWELPCDDVISSAELTSCQQLTIGFLSAPSRVIDLATGEVR